MAVHPFTQAFGEPLAGTAVSAPSLGLAGSVTPPGPTALGVFRGGLLSVCSCRENGGDLGPWAAYLPAGARKVVHLFRGVESPDTA